MCSLSHAFGHKCKAFGHSYTFLLASMRKSLLFSLGTLLASMYGMNVELDLSNPVNLLLAGLRASYRNCGDVVEQRAQRRQALIVFRFIETTVPDLWTSCPLEHELGNSTRVGDHLFVTRRTFGFFV